MRIDVSSNVVVAAASLIGCSILTAPFNYLGLKIGSNMSIITSWNDVISKARLIANGSTQVEGVDIDETFSLVVKSGTIWIVLSLVISRHWHVHQLDVKNAFLHGDLAETIYMHQPLGFWDPKHPNYVCLLQRSLYGLKQAPRA
nr:copia protein [Tanacetum cinerariifolium]